MTPRWEFRVFGDDLEAGRDALARIGEARDEDTRTDIYFVVPGRTDASLKLRDDRLDLKLLREERDGLERWEPAGEAGFPTAAETLRERLLCPAGVCMELPAGPVPRDVILAAGCAARGMRLVPVEKRRRHYGVHGVSAEVTRLLFDGRTVESIAVEDADPERAGRTVAALGLPPHRNTSYQRLLVETVFAPGRVDARRLPSGR